MESNISYIEGRVGIPHNGVLSSDGSQIILKKDGEEVFAARLSDVKIEELDARGVKNFAVVTNEGQRYTFTDVNLNDTDNIIRWLAVVAVVILLAVLAFFARQWAVSFLGNAYNPIVGFIILIVWGVISYVLAITVWNKWLKKVDSTKGKPSHVSFIQKWYEYFQKTCPDKIVLLKPPLQ